MQMAVVVAMVVVAVLAVAFPAVIEAAASDRIANGEDAAVNRYRWFGLVGSGAKKMDPSCGGALIASDFFLMSASPTSCRGVMVSEPFNVKVGVYCLDPRDKNCTANAAAPPLRPEVGEVESRFASVFRQSDFEFPGTGTNADQLALVHFSAPVKGITPVVPDDGTGFALLGADTAVTAVTSGLDKSFEQPSALQSKQLKPVLPSQCEEQHKRLSFSQSLPFGFENITYAFCTENLRGGFCGDSGVSLILPEGASNGADLLLAMYEDDFDSECERTSLPDLSIRISTSFQWIKDVVCTRSVDPPFWCQDGAATVTCPTERNANTFVTPMTRTCQWLAQQKQSMVRKLCKDFQIGSACPVTCASCPSTGEEDDEEDDNDEDDGADEEEEEEEDVEVAEQGEDGDE